MARQPTPWQRKSCGNAWYAQVRGKQEWLAPAEASKTEAWAALRKILAAARPKRADARLTCTDVINLFLDQVKARVARGEREPETFEGYHRYLMKALDAFGTVRAEELAPKDVDAWIDSGHPDWGPTSRFNAVTAVKAAFKWAARQKHIPADPLAGMERPTPKRREEVPTEVQLSQLVAAIPDQQFQDLVVALAESGCRPKEIRTLTADRVFPEEARWRVLNKTRRSTGEKFRDVFLPPVLVLMSRRLVVKHPEGHIFRNRLGNPWTRNAVAIRMKRTGEKLGMGPEACAYAIRHAFATKALVSGIPLATVAALMGHRDTKMLMRVYSKLEREHEHLRAAAVKVRYPDADQRDRRD